MSQPKDNGGNGEAQEVAGRKLTWLDGEPHEAAYRAVALAIDEVFRRPALYLGDGTGDSERWDLISYKLLAIRAAMWNAGTCNLPAR